MGHDGETFDFNAPDVVKLENGVIVKVNLSYVAACKSCGAPFHWGKTTKGKSIPIDTDLKAAHFSTCPFADKFRKQ